MCTHPQYVCLHMNTHLPTSRIIMSCVERKRETKRETEIEKDRKERSNRKGSTERETEGLSTRQRDKDRDRDRKENRDRPRETERERAHIVLCFCISPCGIVACADDVQGRAEKLTMDSAGRQHYICGARGL